MTTLEARWGKTASEMKLVKALEKWILDERKAMGMDERDPLANTVVLYGDAVERMLDSDAPVALYHKGGYRHLSRFSPMGRHYMRKLDDIARKYGFKMRTSLNGAPIFYP